MSERILTREEVEGLAAWLREFVEAECHTAADMLRSLYDSQAADRERISTLENALVDERDIAEAVCEIAKQHRDAAYLQGERIAALERALAQIRDQEPKPFDFPKDWSEQIAACLECKRYKGHPIQQGICDQHRKPLYAREAHESFERKAMGYRASSIARAALQATPPQAGIDEPPEDEPVLW